MRSRLPLLLLSASVLAGAACSRDRTLPPDLDGVYGRLVAARADYEAGLAAVLAGEDVTGENLLRAASTRLAVAVRECARTPGCDERVLATTMEDVAGRRFPGARGADPDTDPDADALPVAEADPEPDAEVDAASVPDAAPADPGSAAERSLLSGASLGSLIPRNARVLAQVNAWLTRMRPELHEAHRNYLHLRSSIAPVYAEAGLPEALLFAMLATESGVKVHAYSRAGAAGPLQFMPATARRYGLRGADGFDARLDPVRATRANARYVLDHLRALRGSLELTLAAYNAGETRLRRIHARHPDASFWDPAVYYAMPLETRTYVARVLAAAWLFLEPEPFGVRFEDIEASSTEVKLAAAASLGELAVCLGNEPGGDGWFRTLRNLNPRLAPSDRIPAGTRLVFPTAAVTAYTERCAPDGPRTLLARELLDADYPARPDVVRYTVRRGDTLAGIAADHRSSVRELARLNGIRPPGYVIRPGQTLEVPARQ